MAYLLVLVFPLGLLVLYALFRWRYVLAIRRAMYSPGATVPDFAWKGPVDATPSSLSLRWTEATEEARAAPAELAVASEITRDVRLRLVIAGAV